MKNLLFIICVAFSFSVAKAQVKSVLFLGNSYTYVNDLPQLIKDIALSFGDTIFTDSNTPGGYQLVQHSTNATTLSKISSRDWDNVIIQEQSQKPSFSPAQVASDVYPYAQILNDSIKSNYSCTETVFYMTWGRKNGDASNCASYPPICTYDGMQQRLRESYMQMSADNNATTAPVGVAWKNVRDSFPTIELYAADESHPSIHGSYLAACVFYVTMYQKSCIGSTFMPLGIGTGDAVILQTVATNTVLDSLNLWRINANMPVANFTYSGSGTINFSNISTNGVSYFWDFGDGNTSTLQNPNNTYSVNNIYPVQLITFSSDSCFSDTITQNVNVIISGITNISNNEKINIYPNPINDFINIETDINYTSILISDISGKVIQSLIFKKIVDVRSLTKGVYFIKLISPEETHIRKLIKN